METIEKFENQESVNNSNLNIEKNIESLPGKFCEQHSNLFWTESESSLTRTPRDQINILFQE